VSGRGGAPPEPVSSGAAPAPAPAPGLGAVDELPVVCREGRGFGHGKVILLGEHAVVYGHPALAAGLSRGMRGLAGPGTGRLRVPVWNLDLHVDATPGAEAGRAPTSDLARVARAWAAILNGFGVRDVDVTVEGDLPAQAGLGSSAAFSCAVAFAVASAHGFGRARALAAAHFGEVVFHGAPSGIDLAAASTGAAGRFQRGQGWMAVEVPRPITLCIGLSGRPHATHDLVEGVRRLHEATPVVSRVIEALGALAPSGEAALAAGDLEALGRLFDVAHGLLASLRVSGPELETLVHGARRAGALGAKLTGAGGGGSVIALAPPGREAEILEAWRHEGFEGFTANVVGARPDVDARHEVET